MAELQIFASAPELDTMAIGIFFRAGDFSMKEGLVCDGSTNIARIIGVGSTDCYPTKQKDLTDRSQSLFVCSLILETRQLAGIVLELRGGAEYQYRMRQDSTQTNQHQNHLSKTTTYNRG